jgi:molybdopterin synthase catalytic subunit
MKVINIIGHSCSGKTTFISRLVVKLKDLGPVATIKHLGHHNFSLEKEKDTTIFYERGIDISAGIDSEKTVIAIRNNDLTSILDLLADQGIEYTVMEGFKTIGLPAVVIGDLESDKVLFRNPGLDEVMDGMEQFPEYSTMKSIEAGLKKEALKTGLPGCFVMTATIPAKFTKKQFSSGFVTFQKITTDITKEISREYHQVLVSVGFSNCWNFSTRSEFLIAVIAEDFEAASFVVSAVYERIKKETADEK